MDIHAPELPQPVSARLWHVRVIFDDGTEDKIINSVYPQNAWRDYDEACQHYGHRGRVIVEARDLSPWYEVDPSDICA